MPFLKFTETARSYRAKCSLRSNGTIGFNGGAVNKFDLGKYDWAVLFFDKERRLIGIQPTKNEKEEGVHKINRGKTGAWVAARRFLDYYELVPAKTKRFDAAWDAEEKMIVVRTS
jgi:hypothetical protein